MQKRAAAHAVQDVSRFERFLGSFDLLRKEEALVIQWGWKKFTPIVNRGLCDSRPKFPICAEEGVKRETVSGPTLTPKKMVSAVRKLTADWNYDAVSVGYPGLVAHNRPVADPWNLGKGWAGFNFQAAFKRPVKVVNDAALQALGSYKGGKMLFLGLGTGLGSALIVDGIIEPMELGHLPYKKATFEDYVGIRGLDKYGKQKWRCYVADVVRRLIAALEPDDVVLGGGNIHKLKKLPAGCRAGDNANAFLGGFRLWQDSGSHRPSRRFVRAEVSRLIPKERTIRNTKL